MRHKISFICLMLLTSGIVQATSKCDLEDGPYFAFNIGASKVKRWNADLTHQHTHFKTGSVFRVAVGSQFSRFRAEFEPSFFRTKYKEGPNGGHVQLISTLGNLYIGLPFGSIFDYPISPYVGGGIGFSSVKSNFKGTQAQTNQGHHTTLAYQGILGVRFALNEEAGLNIEYRYFQSERLNIGKRIQSHSANIGITYKF